MASYRISADALLRLAILADNALGANAGIILALLKEAEEILAPMPDVAADPSLDLDAGGADKPAKPE